ncbi:RteC domain-containing protein [Lutibacter maritimus]|uniref:RteC protein n=1 Tax=Lutibacter maritimus TaxID=593133 RepID=A0A1I6Q0P9_9FLAO|nr:RteC domain-containing protein [Lutibacter maritimus]SFS46047.1 RteC protein [Lutibacter maritimus]
MKKKYAIVIATLEKDLKNIQSKNYEIVTTSEESVHLIRNSLSEFRNFIISNGFNSEEDEIDFFKNIKPKVVSKLIYYGKLFQIESKRPKGSAKTQKKYFENQISKCQEYFNENHLFYLYFKGGETYSDEQYFLRNNKNIRTQFDCSGSFIDDFFSTSLDSTYSKFIAYEMLIQYFHFEIDKLSSNNGISLSLNSGLTWTGRKISLIELTYALEGLGVINNGNTDIKEIARGMELLFNIDLGDYYRAFLEIKGRKLNNTKFIDTLKSNLLSRIENSDN